MICPSPNCKKEISEDAIYCPYCGKIIKKEELANNTIVNNISKNTSSINQIKRIDNVKLISGLEDIKNEKNVNIIFDNEKILLSTDNNIGATGIKFKPDVNYDLPYSQVDKVLLYRDSRTVVIKTLNNEIVLVTKNIFKILKGFKEHNEIKIEQIGEFEKPNQPIGVTLIGLIVILLNSSLIFFLGKDFIDNNYEEINIYLFFIIPTLFGIFVHIEFLRGKSWAYSVIVFILFINLIVATITLVIFDQPILFTSIIGLAINCGIIFYLRKLNVREYFEFNEVFAHEKKI